MFNLFKKEPKKVWIDKKALLGSNRDDLVIKGTQSVPSIHFKKDGNCIIGGYSRPEDLDGIYSEAKEFIIELVNNGVKINFTFDFDYFNSTTQRYNYDLLAELSKQKTPGVTIWKYFYDDEDMLDMGVLYKKSYPELKIKLKSKNQ